jgi:transposase
MPRPTGRTTKLTPQIQQKIVDAIKAGNYQETAATYAGITPSTFYRWMQQAEQPRAPRPLREFREAVLEARAQAEVRNVALVQKAANDGSWQAATWFLERSFQNRWGKNPATKLEVSGPEGGNLKMDVSVEHLNAKIEEILGGASGG